MSDESPAWSRWGHTLRERPAVIAAAAAALMIIIAVPFFSMRLGSADAGSDPVGSPTRQAYDLLAKGFGSGYNGPLQLIAQVTNQAQQAAFTKVTTAVAKSSGVVRVTAPRLISVKPASRASPRPTSIPAARHRMHPAPTSCITCETRSYRIRVSAVCMC
jgi:RND superfamily putative drug exporter